MPIPTNTSGSSWITGSAGGSPVASALPTPFVVSYESILPVGYFGCGIDSDYVAVEAGNFSSNTVEFLKQASGVGILRWSWRASVVPGVIDSIIYHYFRGTRAIISDIELNYGTTTALTGSRWGLMVNRTPSSSLSSSAQLSIEPNIPASMDSYVGDIWFAPYQSGSGLRFTDLDSFGNKIELRALGGYDNVPLAETIYPIQPQPRHLLVNGVFADNWFYTLNSYYFSGAGITNYNYGSGIYMFDSGTVAVFGPNQHFKIPSGSLRVNGNLMIYSASFDHIFQMVATTASIVLYSGSLSSLKFNVQGASSSIFIGGASSSAYLNYRPFSVLMAPQSASVFDSGVSGSDGTIFVMPLQGEGAWVLAGSQWTMLYSSSADYSLYDGGVY